MIVYDPANVYLDNIYVDTDHLTTAFSFYPDWNYPEAFLTPVLVMENMTFYSSDGITSSRPKCLEYKLPGNVTVRNIDLTTAYNQASDGDSHFVVNTDPEWAPNDGLIRNVEMHETKLSLQNNDARTKTNLLVIGVGVTIDRHQIFNFTDSYIENFQGGIYGSVALMGGFGNEAHFSNIHYK